MFRKIYTRKTFLGLLLVALISSTVVFAAHQITHTKLTGRGGKNIAEWFDREVLEDHPVCGVAPRNFEARMAILNSGDEAIPFLIAKAQQTPSCICSLYDQIHCRLPIALMLRLPTSQNYLIPMERSTAIGLLGEIVSQNTNNSGRIGRISPQEHKAALRCLTTCSRTNEAPEIRTAAIRALAGLQQEKFGLVP